MTAPDSTQPPAAGRLRPRPRRRGARDAGLLEHGTSGCRDPRARARTATPRRSRQPTRCTGSPPADVPDGARMGVPRARRRRRRAAGRGVRRAARTSSFAAPAGWAGLRAVGGSLSPRDAGAFVEALSLGRWLLEAPFCPACGARTDARATPAGRGAARRAGAQHFPRTDPAVIVAITSAERPRPAAARLQRAVGRATGSRASPGFVEAGESLEAAVAPRGARGGGRGGRRRPLPRVAGMAVPALAHARLPRDRGRRRRRGGGRRGDRRGALVHARRDRRRARGRERPAAARPRIDRPPPDQRLVRGRGDERPRARRASTNSSSRR